IFVLNLFSKTPPQQTTPPFFSPLVVVVFFFGAPGWGGLYMALIGVANPKSPPCGGVFVGFVFWVFNLVLGVLLVGVFFVGNEGGG
ncbi:hypothetical protein QN402_31665, partial [Pseudomonas sp. FG1]|nr:hypothetical protein [Pseudomonas sp. FG1]